MNEKSPATAPRAAKKASALPSSNLSAWLPETLIQTVKQLAQDSGQSPTDFVKHSLENEISRRSLCKPERELSLKDIKLQLDQVSEQLARREVNERRILAALEVITVAMGVNI